MPEFNFPEDDELDDPSGGGFSDFNENESGEFLLLPGIREMLDPESEFGPAIINDRMLAYWEAMDAALEQVVATPSSQPDFITDGEEMGNFDDILVYPDTPIGTVALATHRGGRPQAPNQDRILFVRNGPDTCFGISDGLGKMGAAASQIVSEEILFGTNDIFQAATVAAERIVQISPVDEKNGASLAFVKIQPDIDTYSIKTFHAGDSRVMILMPSEEGLTQTEWESWETMDENRAADLLRAGQISEAEFAVHRHRSTLTNMIGSIKGKPFSRIERFDLHAPSGSIVITCTDGLTHNLFTGEIIEELGREMQRRKDQQEPAMTAPEICRFLYDLAMANMRHHTRLQQSNDNISIAVTILGQSDSRRPPSRVIA